MLRYSAVSAVIPCEWSLRPVSPKPECSNQVCIAFAWLRPPTRRTLPSPSFLECCLHPCPLIVPVAAVLTPTYSIPSYVGSFSVYIFFYFCIFCRAYLCVCVGPVRFHQSGWCASSHA